MAASVTRQPSARGSSSTGRILPADAAAAAAAVAHPTTPSSSSSSPAAAAPPWKRLPSISSSSASSGLISPPASSSSSFPYSSPSNAHRRTASSSSSSAAATTPTSRQQPSTPSSSSSPSSASTASSFEQSLFNRPLTAAEQSYVKELTSYSMSRLEREPALLQEREEEIQRAIESLAVKNYRTFVETAEAVHSAHQAVVDMEAQLGMMEEQLPRFSQRCDEFVHKSASTRSAQKLNRCMTEHHSQLLDLLEIPQLMETCVRSALYEEALELYAYAASLARRHPHIAVMQDVLSDMRLIKRSIQSALLSLLSGPIQLAQCLKVVSYLRRLDGYDEPTLRQQFITSRDGFLDGLTAGIISAAPASASASAPASSSSASSGALSPYEAVSRYLDCSRVHVFDIVTQYRAIFVDDSSGSEEERSDDGGLLFRWIHHRVAVLLSALAQHLPQVSEGSYLYNLLEQSLYCGSSLSRVGVDFRPLLPPLFSAAILSMFNTALAPACDAMLSAMASHPWYMQRKELTRMGLPMERSSAIMSFPPLTVACNVFIHALNKLRHAALLALAAAIAETTEATLLALASSLRSYASTEYQPYGIASDEWEGERDAMAVLARGLADELLPAVQRLVRSVYGDALPAEGGSTGSLQKARAVLSVLYESDERERRRRADDRRRKEEERRRDEERQKRVMDRQLQDRERDSKRQADEQMQQEQQQQQQQTEAGETAVTEANAEPEVKQAEAAEDEQRAAIHP